MREREKERERMERERGGGSVSLCHFRNFRRSEFHFSNGLESILSRTDPSMGSSFGRQADTNRRTTSNLNPSLSGWMDGRKSKPMDPNLGPGDLWTYGTQGLRNLGTQGPEPEPEPGHGHGHGHSRQLQHTVQEQPLGKHWRVRSKGRSSNSSFSYLSQHGQPFWVQSIPFQACSSLSYRGKSHIHLLFAWGGCIRSCRCHILMISNPILWNHLVQSHPIPSYPILSYTHSHTHTPLLLPPP